MVGAVAGHADLCVAPVADGCRLTVLEVRPMTGESFRVSLLGLSPRACVFIGPEVLERFLELFQDLDWADSICPQRVCSSA